jgi:Zn-dependent protease with chaperone function
MAHVLRSHSVNRLLTSEVIQLLSRGSPVTGILKPILSRLIHQLVTQGYSRSQEYEADKAAVRICRVAGYDPEASIRLFQRLQARADEPGALAGYFSSHPPFGRRIERISGILAERR